MRFHLYVIGLVASLAFCAPVLPNFFDARTKWPQCVYPVYDQLSCNSSWAHAVAGMMSNRYCIRHDGQKLELSPQDLLCQSEERCSGEHSLERALMNANTVGLLTRECWPYTGEDKYCPESSCAQSGVDFKRYKCDGYRTFKPEDVKQEIYDNGPVVCEFQETIDHQEYYDGIYYRAHNKKRYPFKTAMKVIGWGIENGMNYWIAEQSLGQDFGENGYVRYKIIDNFCSMAYSCNPQ